MTNEEMARDWLETIEIDDPADIESLAGAFEQAREAGRREVYDKLLGTDPCPECGTGIVEAVLKALAEILRRLEAE